MTENELGNKMQIIIIGACFSITRNTMDIPKIGEYVRCGVYGDYKVIKRTKIRNQMIWRVEVC
jgi:hypothetical protein